VSSGDTGNSGFLWRNPRNTHTMTVKFAMDINKGSIFDTASTGLYFHYHQSLATEDQGRASWQKI
jgi:hypothetical protein